MTTKEAIKQLQTEHDLIAGERDLDGSQFAPALLEALAMAIEVLKCSEIPNCSEPKCADGCITDDIISRADLLKQIDIDAGEGRGYYGDTWKFIDTIKKMPSVQPEKMQLSGESTTKDATSGKDTNVPSNDTISRKAAIDAQERKK